jgi:hypothetical protein
MTALTASPQRPIPTVPVSPALLQEGDMIYPDVQEPSPKPFRVISAPQRLASGWRLELERHCVLLVAKGHKVRTQRRPNPGPPTPDGAWDAAMDSYREPRYG